MSLLGAERSAHCEAESIDPIHRNDSSLRSLSHGGNVDSSFT